MSQCPALSVSTRQSIQFGQDAHAEYADVLVLISNKGFFVDLRVDRKTKELDWAMAGWKRSRELEDGRTHATFEALFDSRSEIIPEEKLRDAPPDEAYFSPLPNSQTLETGRMMNPDRAWQVESYEEIWDDLDLTENARCLILRSAKGDDAFLARIGQWQLAVLKKGSEYQGIRWQRQQDGSWKTIYQSHGATLPPFQVDIASSKLSEGQSVDHGGLKWTIQEIS